MSESFVLVDDKEFQEFLEKYPDLSLINGGFYISETLDTMPVAVNMADSSAAIRKDILEKFRGRIK